MSTGNKYSIKMVSAMTGLSSHLIRAWEKRYNAITPDRSPGKRRLFSDADVERLVLLRNAVTSGYRISDIAGKENDELLSITNSARSNISINNEVSSFSEKAISAIENYNPSELENVLFESSIKLNQNELINQLIIPLITEIGERWHQGIFNIAQEHLSTPVLISFLHYLKGIFKVSRDAPLILTCAPKGQFHELGALIISAISASNGWKVIHLGTNLPAYEIAASRDFIKAKIICLSIVYPYDDPELRTELLYFKRNIKENTLILAGGSAAHSYKRELDEAGIQLVTDVQEFLTILNNQNL